MMEGTFNEQNKTSELISDAQNPLTFTGIRLKKRKKKAAGAEAIWIAASHIFSAMKASKGIRTLFKLNQKNGFDCPGCAWPDPDGKRSSLGEYCENGVKAIAEEATDKRITLDFFKKYTLDELAKESDYWLGQQGRLTHPVILRDGKTNYEAISWKDAFQFIGKQLRSLSHPDEAVFYTSGRTSNEAAFLYQLFVRAFGTNNMPDCSNMCHESSGAGLSETLGIGKGSVTLDDFKKSELIIVMGQNPGTNHPRMLIALEEHKKRGGKIMSINPLPEAGLMNFVNPQQALELLSGKGTVLTDLFLQVKINGDVPLLKAVMKLMLEEEEKKPGTAFDLEFIKDKTSGFEAFIENLKQKNLAELSRLCGIPLEKIREATEMILAHQKIIICWAMGLTQHKNAVDNVRECVNLLLLKGSIGKPGAGTCPVRGHSNVQGDRTMGIWERPKKAFLDALQKEFNFNPPRTHGFSTIEAIQAMEEGKAKVLIALGGNFLSATPDTEFTARALQNCELTVHISTKLNRSHLVQGKNALILPCLGRTEKDLQKSGEQFVSVENSTGVVHQSKGHLPPASEHLLSEPAIVAGMAQATLEKNFPVDWEELISNYDKIRDLIEKIIPGFENYNQRVRQPGGFYLPNGPREGKFHTLDGKAHFTLNALPQHQLEKGQYLMMTIRSHDQFNTTIYGLHDRYRGIYNERRVVLMNEKDMEEAGLQKLELVHLVSHFMGEKRIARRFLVIPYDIPRECVATYFPEANVLIPLQHYADISLTPASKSVVVSVEKDI